MESAERVEVRRALDALKPYLAAFVRQHIGQRAQSASPDIAGLLKSIVIEWDSTFANHLPRVVRSYVHELLDVRNRWAHEQEFTRAETTRALDTVKQVALAIGAPQPGAESSRTGRKSQGVASSKWSGQRDIMREIYVEARGNESRIIREYAEAERAGRVRRKENKSGLTAEEYAKALLRDGLKKGWLKVAVT